MSKNQTYVTRRFIITDTREYQTQNTRNQRLQQSLSILGTISTDRRKYCELLCIELRRLSIRTLHETDKVVIHQIRNHYSSIRTLRDFTGGITSRLIENKTTGSGARRTALRTSSQGEHIKYRVEPESRSTAPNVTAFELIARNRLVSRIRGYFRG